MPESFTASLRQGAAANARDVRATFRETYSSAAFQALQMPLTVVVGERSPEITHQVAAAIASLVPSGSVVTLDRADHTLTTTHADAVAEVIAAAAADGGSRPA